MLPPSKSSFESFRCSHELLAAISSLVTVIADSFRTHGPPLSTDESRACVGEPLRHPQKSQSGVSRTNPRAESNAKESGPSRPCLSLAPTFCVVPSSFVRLSPCEPATACSCCRIMLSAIQVRFNFENKSPSPVEGCKGRRQNHVA